MTTLERTALPGSLRTRRRRGAPAALAPLFAAALSLAAAGLAPGRAHACGCLAPPDPANPAAQAGERILFSVAGGQVTAIIQIQFSGTAQEFGWLLPLPSIPKLEVSSDEVFSMLIARTTPSYKVSWKVGGNCAFTADLGAASVADPGDPLVAQGGVGPYDYAVLKADDQKAMLDWLSANHYFVPVGTGSVVAPYIHPGAYFLALKLKPGATTGDLTPVVVHYASDLPMIPITLTSVTAVDNMGVWVWLLGPGRAIPRNYHHVVPNDALLAWQSVDGGLPSNYEAQVAAAVREAPGRHAFVTEAAAPLTAGEIAALFPPEHFGSLDPLRATRAAPLYLGYLRAHGFTFSATLVDILKKYIKQPAHLALPFGGGREPSPASYYYNFNFWYSRNPTAFHNFDLSFDPVALTDEIERVIVAPARAAVALFSPGSWLTRLHTVLSPVDMNSDPVFSFNPGLPAVSTAHAADGVWSCGMTGITDLSVTTEQGFRLHGPPTKQPAALRVERISETGAPTVEVDNRSAILAANGQQENGQPVASSGCRVGGRELGWPGGLALVALLAAALRRGRRRILGVLASR